MKEEILRAIGTMKQRKMCEFCQLADNDEECMKQEDCKAIPYDVLKQGYNLALIALQEQLDRVEGCGWCHHCSSCIYSLNNKDDAPCSCCEVKGIELTNFYARPYCPSCGRKLKNESEE